MNLFKNKISLFLLSLISFALPLAAMERFALPGEVPPRTSTPGPIKRSVSPQLDDYNTESVEDVAVENECTSPIESEEFVMSEDYRIVANFWCAIKENNAKYLDWLVRKHGFDFFSNLVREDGATPVFIAALFGADDSFRFLVDDGFSLESGHPEFSTLYAAIESESVSIVKYLLAHFYDLKESINGCSIIDIGLSVWTV